MRDGIIYDCPSVNCKTPIYTGKCRKDCLEKRNKEIGINHQTNADKIRAMSDEELAKYLHSVHLGLNEWCDFHCEYEGENGCHNCILPWLKQPAERGE